jgi:hypothetical protein
MKIRVAILFGGVRLNILFQNTLKAGVPII